MRSQLNLTDRLKDIANYVQGEGIDLVTGLRDKVYESREFRSYN